MSTAWNAYEAVAESRGINQRETSLNREKHFLKTRLKDSLSSHPVTKDNSPCDAAVINSDNLNEKTIISLNNAICCGDLIRWMENFWLITELDANIEVYTKAKMKQCNHLLKWIDDAGVIKEQWCVIEDGTKYLSGDYEDRDFVATRGDTRVQMTIARNPDTIKLNRNNRFLIDDPDFDKKIAFQLTKPLKVGRVYNGKGVFCFILQETQTTDDDNIELGITDYYKYFPRDKDWGGRPDNDNPEINPDDKTDDDGRQVWI